MALPRTHYLTPNGLPPNGGYPPGVTRAAAPQSVASPPPPHIPPRPDYGVMPVYSPAPAAVAPRPDYGYPPSVPFCCPMQPAPPQLPAAAPTTAPPRPAPDPSFPPGTHIDGATVDFGTNMRYLFPERQNHTVIHYFLDMAHPWENPGGSPRWAVYLVPTLLTVKQLIRQLGGGNGNDEQSGISECFEVGDGAWLKGSTFMLSDNKSDQTLEALGWTESRGTVSKPVWIALHKA